MLLHLLRKRFSIFNTPRKDVAVLAEQLVFRLVYVMSVMANFLRNVYCIVLFFLLWTYLKKKNNIAYYIKKKMECED